MIGVRAVLYTHDFEPITVVELPKCAKEYLEREGQVTLSVITPPKPSFEPMDRPRSVRITADMLVRRGQRHLMLFTDDEEAALLLQAAFLPGQRRAIAEERAQAFARGFMKALYGIG